MLTAFVLMMQNCMSKPVGRHPHFDLQINLMTVRETANIIRMRLEISDRVGIQQKVLDGK